jgi:hypothetical protein
LWLCNICRGRKLIGLGLDLGQQGLGRCLEQYLLFPTGGICAAIHLTTHPGKSPDTLCLLPLNGVFEQNLVRSTVSRRATIQPGPTRQTRRATLLDHVGQLVCHQAPTPLRSRRVLTSPERNVAAHRVRPCAQLCRRLRGGIIGVKAHAAEIDAKPRLEELPFRGRQRTAAALQLANAPL